jgi:hypothetical protein
MTSYAIWQRSADAATVSSSAAADDNRAVVNWRRASLRRLRTVPTGTPQASAICW